jgi:hypothetical protein
MTYMAPKLKNRVQFQQGVDTPNNNGGFDRSYTELTSCWAEVKNVSKYIEAVRNEQIKDEYTLEIVVRKSSVDRLGTAFSSAFSGAFNSIPDINPIKSDWYCFIEAGESYKGRLFRVAGTKLDERNSEYLVIRLREVEEHGTGGNE